MVDTTEIKLSSPEADRREDCGKPYFYHTTSISGLMDILQAGELKDPNGGVTMFTADILGLYGELLVN